MSAKKRRELKETKPIREVKPGEQCELCGSTLNVATHEVPAGSHRHRAVHDRRCQMRLCSGPGSCHEHVQGLSYELQIVLRIESFIAGINEAHGSIAVTNEMIKEAI